MAGAPGVTPPPGGQPRHTITANSYRTIPEEPGTRAELRDNRGRPEWVFRQLLGEARPRCLRGGAAHRQRRPQPRRRDRSRQAAHGRDGASGRVMKRINERLKSKRGLADIARDAEEIRAAATRIPSLFPPGTRDGQLGRETGFVAE